MDVQVSLAPDSAPASCQNPTRRVAVALTPCGHNSQRKVLISPQHEEIFKNERVYINSNSVPYIIKGDENGGKKSVTLAREVARLVYGPAGSKTVRQINGDKTDVRAENIVYVPRGGKKPEVSGVFRRETKGGERWHAYAAVALEGEKTRKCKVFKTREEAVAYRRSTLVAAVPEYLALFEPQEAGEIEILRTHPCPPLPSAPRHPWDGSYAL